MNERVAIIGASDNPERYSYLALQLLDEMGHTPIPIHPRLERINRFPVVASLQELVDSREQVDTVTMYVGAKISNGMGPELIALHPRRVIFNPGAENPLLQKELEAAGIETVAACTLVLLRTGQF